MVAPEILLGVGLGGFVDGIVLQQILQWHHIVSQAPAPLVAAAAPYVVAGLVAAGLSR
ncbi:MAG: DUF2243 domain-containing protein [Nitriliruptoraceae bacterium]